jgi:hypothetical protein
MAHYMLLRLFFLMTEYTLVPRESSDCMAVTHISFRAVCLYVWPQENTWCNCTSFSFSFVNSSTILLIGPLRTGDAFWDWKNRVAVVFDCVLPTGKFIVFSSRLLWIPIEVLSNQTEAHLLFTNRPRNRESTSGIEKTNGLQDITGRDRRRQGEGNTISGVRFDQ